MSLTSIALAAAAAASTPDDGLTRSIEVALPSLDTGRGLAAGYERWLPEHRLAIELRGELRESASGDYTGLRIGVGVEARWFWRSRVAAALSVLPAGSPVGWFLSAGSYIATDLTHDDEDQRWLGSALQVGGAGRVGYRIAPWRHLLITPSAGLEVQRDLDLSGRLAGVTRGGVTVGLDAGWLF